MTAMTTDKSNSIDSRHLLQDAFALEQELLQVQLKLSSESIAHSGTQGDVNEDHFIAILRRYLPKRYEVDRGIVIDSVGSTSDQIDVIIYDNQYSPTLLDQHKHRYVPAEAVYAVFEVKPTVNKVYLEYAGGKAKSVRKLKRTSVPIPHAGGEHPPKELFPIVAGIIAAEVDWTDGFDSVAFREQLGKLNEPERLDCGLAVSGSCFDAYAGEVDVTVGGRVLAYFLFRLLRKLQTMATVPAVDWDAYGSVLREEIT